MSPGTSEKGLETLTVRHLTGLNGLNVPPSSPAPAPDPAGICYFAGRVATLMRIACLNDTFSCGKIIHSRFR